MIEDFYTTAAVVKQANTSTTGMGGGRRTFSTRIATLMCRINPKQVTEADEYGKRTLRELWVLYCASTTTTLAIIESDRVEVGTRTFEVTGIGNPGYQNHHLEIDMFEVR